ncbi:hypothetical protein [Streptomyces yaizuensis]|uniref:Secreted protein n=1 Tax=Streptomyces yaizuensis TaxID=2989713 RepID=A0ABQ5P4M8_9ACTN|nr:hypothetical protein [Streptomyces sp. YSPA8]GLF97221.1 hypothetical protein SYYSPA8_23010 [Streptomyces sp. YSPA8]
MVILASSSSAHAAPPPQWNKNKKCQQEDLEGRVVLTRHGNGELGWRHFSGRHNIKKCRVVNGPINGKPDKVTGARLEYWGYAINGSRQVKIVVIAQHSRKTADGRYDAGRGQKIGVITAYCKGMNRCPDWVNE